MPGKSGRKSTSKQTSEGADTNSTEASMEATIRELLPEETDPGNKNVSAKLDFLTRLLCTVATLVKGIQHSLEFNHEDIKAIQNDMIEIRNEMKEMKAEATNLQQQLTESKMKNKEMKEHILRLESQSRRDNLKISGIPEAVGAETWEECKEKVYCILEENLEIPNARNIKITRCQRLGQKNPGQRRPRTIILKLHWFGDRELIWASRRKLKGTNYWLEEDFPSEIDERRRTLLPIARAARLQNKKSTVNVDRLLIDGRSYTVETLSQLPDHLQPSRLATKTDGKVTAFFRSDTPLSNFHQVPITDDAGRKFHSSEQWYQYQKAVEFNDNDTAASIMKAQKPIECYRLGLQINNFNKNQWKTKAKGVMLKAVKAKFSQNKQIQKHLKDTGNTMIAEANPRDNLWSVGMAINDKDIFNMDMWKGDNWMGEILVSVRDQM